MARGRGRPAVRPDQYRQWLQRVEEGETPPHIAATDGYDVRTVRKYIEMARQEREFREARSMVLRGALEEHYADLVTFARLLDSRLNNRLSGPVPERKERMWSALRSHLPQSPIWKLLDRWEQLGLAWDEMDRQALSRMNEKVAITPWPDLSKEAGSLGLRRDGLSLLVRDRLRALAEDPNTPLWQVISDPRPEGLVQLICNGRNCALVPKDMEHQAKALVLELMEEMKGWPEVGSLTRISGELKEVAEALREELAILILRRVVPGRCRYCPF